MTPQTKGKKVNGKESNGKAWMTPAVLLGIMSIIGGVGIHLINKNDVTSLERTSMVKEGLQREMDTHVKRADKRFEGIDNRLERIEGKIDKLILHK